MRLSPGQNRHRDLAVWAALIILGVAVLLTGGAIAQSPADFGDPIPGLTAEQQAQFAAGKDEFEEEETIEEGLGPVFNNVSCAACHSRPAIGGDTGIRETRFGRTRRGKADDDKDHQDEHNENDGNPRREDGKFDPMKKFGGSLLQSRGIGDACVGETVPPDAHIVARRKTTPLFGLGLVDHVLDSTLEQLANAQKEMAREVAGRPAIVDDVATGKKMVGRFGWKAQVATLQTFSGEAYLNEMGITNPLFPKENAPQGNKSLLKVCDTVADPEDDGTGVQGFTDFMTLLAPPPRGPITPQVQAGEAVFTQIGCAICHHPTLTTGASDIAPLSQVTFHPFSDFLLHDMGSLGDGIEQGDASGSEMRTAPLWGLRVRETFLHDGRASTVNDAILAHDGQGLSARIQFTQLNSVDMEALIAFLKSL
jgi:CxxC motif-containing protein (DUF1111 family)